MKKVLDKIKKILYNKDVNKRYTIRCATGETGEKREHKKLL